MDEQIITEVVHHETDANRTFLKAIKLPWKGL